MFQTRWFRLLFVVLVSAGAIWLLARDHPIPLSSVPAVPRPEPVAETGTSALAFGSVDNPHLSRGEDLREYHNALVDDLKHAIAAYKNESGSIRTAEQIEMRVFVARHQLGAIDDRTYHARLALLFERELARLDQLAAMEKPQAGEKEIADARLFVARERHLAGDADADYAAMRLARIAYYEDRIKYLQSQRDRNFESLKEELRELLAEFPEPRAHV